LLLADDFRDVRGVAENVIVRSARLAGQWEGLELVFELPCFKLLRCKLERAMGITLYEGWSSLGFSRSYKGCFSERSTPLGKSGS